MSRRLTWSGEARKQMRRLGSESARRVHRAVIRYFESGHGDVKSLLGRKNDEKRLRVGKMRVVFKETADELEIVSVLPRDKAYRTHEPMEAYGTVELSMAGAA